MEFAVKRFARNIFLLHLLLLAVVLTLVLFASIAIKDGAREQAQQQAEKRQLMLASQTARGIEGFYHSILSDMDLLPRQEDSESERGKIGSILKEVSREFSFPLGPSSQPSTRPTTLQSQVPIGPRLSPSVPGRPGGQPPPSGRPRQ